MRILILSADYPPMHSGMGDYACHLISALKTRGHSVAVLTSRDITSSTADPSDDIFVYRTVPSWNNESWPAVRRAVEVFTPDIFHIQFMTTTFNYEIFVHSLPKRLKNAFPSLRVITTYHEFAAPWQRLSLWPLFRNSEGHLVTNERHLSFLKFLQKFGIVRGPVQKIPLAANVLPSPASRPSIQATRESLGVKENELMFIRFGILHDVIVPYIAALIRVFDRAQKEGLPLKLVLLGKAEPAALETLLKQFHRSLPAGIIFKNNLTHPEISAYLSAGDAGIAIYPDGVSEKRTALLALLAHGLPVLATQKGKLPSEFQNGVNLLTLDIRADETQWLETLKIMSAQKTLRDTLSKNALKTLETHRWESIAQKTEQFYQEFLPQ